MQVDVEIGILMHDDEPLQTCAGEIRPDFRRGRRRRAAGEVEEIDLERIGQGCGVHVPVVQVEAAAEAQHDVADLLTVPELAYHLFSRRISLRNRHPSTSLDSHAAPTVNRARCDPT